MDNTDNNNANPSKIYIGNLPWSTDENTLRDIFSKYGEITDLVIIKDRNTGRSKGFGFVTYNTSEEAEAAIAEMDGQELETRQLVVKIARPKEENRDRGGFRNNNRRNFRN